MKALVIGLGSMGKRRVRCLRYHGVESIAGFDLRDDRRALSKVEYNIETRETLVAADLGDFDVVVISTPPDRHHEYIGWAIDAKRPCFVEASVVRDPLPALETRARAQRVLIAPSCTLRFHPAIRDITAIVKSGRYGKICNFSYHCGQYLPDWHPWEKVTDYYVSNPLTGGAREIVPFELTWLVDAMGWPSEVYGMKMRTTDVGAPIDDTYIALLQFHDFLGSIAIDVVARHATRRLTLNFETSSLWWDWNEAVVRIFEAPAGREIEYHQPKLSAHVGYNANISEAMYIEEIGSFLAAAKGKGTFPHSLTEDIRVLELLERIEAKLYLTP
jgi:predicted dehydrogenase